MTDVPVAALSCQVPFALPRVIEVLYILRRQHCSEGLCNQGVYMFGSAAGEGGREVKTDRDRREQRQKETLEVIYGRSKGLRWLSN